MAGYIIRRNRYATREIKPENRDPAPATPIPARKCRRCGGTNVVNDGGVHRNANGTKTRYCICKDCGTKNTYVENP